MDSKNSVFPTFALADLHAHLATSINPSTYWQIAHAQGFKLPKKDFEEFVDYLMLSKDRKMELNDYFKEIYHPLLDRLSSGTYAVEKASYEIMSGAHRNNIKLIELRLNPMKHNQNAEIDLDYITLAILRGMERALLEYPDLRAGIIFCLAREFDFEKNKIIIEKAIKYHKRGVVGIDVAGPADNNFRFSDYKEIFRKAKEAGLKVTVHAGEVEEANDIWEAIEYVNPQRIGHGIMAAKDKELMAKLRTENIVLEVCPLSNLMTKAVKDLDEIKQILRTFVDNGVKFTVNTDWPEVIENAHLWKQFKMLKDENILSEEELKTCNQTAFDATFIPEGGLNAYL